VSVHSVQCPNVSQLLFDSERRIDVQWDTAEGAASVYDVRLVLGVDDRPGILAKVLSAIADEQSNVKNMDARTSDGREGRVSLVIAVSDRQQMQRVMDRIRKVGGVRQVERVRS